MAMKSSLVKVMGDAPETTNCCTNGAKYLSASSRGHITEHSTGVMEMFKKDGWYGFLVVVEVEDVLSPSGSSSTSSSRSLISLPFSSNGFTS